jgi:acyl-coenzyme A thioesterase 13
MGTLALIAVDHTRPGVSVEIGVTYISAAKEGTVLVATGTALKAGRSLGFTEVAIRIKVSALAAFEGVAAVISITNT